MIANNIYVIRCDRCGKECVTNNRLHYFIQNKKFKNVKFTQPKNLLTQTYKYDLCKDCLKELERFMRKEEGIE